MPGLIHKLFPSFFPAERINTPFNYLEVNKLDGQWLLDSKHVNYSFGTLHRVFQEALNTFIPDLSEIKEVLILGFGAGSVAHILQKEKNYQGNITGVEIDQQVIKLAKKYFHLEEIQHLKIHIQDAEEFAKDSQQQFDLIIIDLFTDHLIPEKFETEAFLSTVNSLLSSKGKLLYNRMNNTSSNQVKTEAFSKTFHQVFKNNSEEKTIQLRNKIFFAQK
ncbi:MAG: fused MFS/spermidine synthase [Bacteroidales bacterium]|nr:fused MFS/spermidine synthase [Bacteroidales bacterium]